MESDIKKFKSELKKLIDEGELLRMSMALDLGLVDEAMKEEPKKIKLPSFYNVSVQSGQKRGSKGVS